MYLNHQYIKIMKDLKVNSNMFMKLQNDVVEWLRCITLSAINAASFLKREFIDKAARVSWLIQKLYYVEFEFLKNFFLREAVELIVLFLDWSRQVESSRLSRVLDSSSLDLGQDSWLEYSSRVEMFDLSNRAELESWNRVSTRNSRPGPSRHEGR